MTKKTTLITAATAALLTAGAASYVVASTPEDIHVSYEGTIKPGATITVTATCGDSEVPVVASSLTGTIALTDGSGTITLPANIGPGPDQGYHTLTATCGESTHTVRLGDDGNGTAKTIADKNS